MNIRCNKRPGAERTKKKGAEGEEIFEWQNNHQLGRCKNQVSLSVMVTYLCLEPGIDPRELEFSHSCFYKTPLKFIWKMTVLVLL